VGNRLIDQEEEEGGEEEERGRRRRELREGRRRRGSMLSLADEDGQADGRTKFLYESREKSSLQSVLTSYRLLVKLYWRIFRNTYEIYITELVSDFCNYFLNAGYSMVALSPLLYC